MRRPVWILIMQIEETLRGQQFSTQLDIVKKTKMIIMVGGKMLKSLRHIRQRHIYRSAR